MKFILTRKFVNHLSILISENKTKKVLELVSELHCADIAEIFEEIEFDKSVYLYKVLDDETSADVLVELDDDIRERLLETLSTKEIAEKLKKITGAKQIKLALKVDPQLIGGFTIEIGSKMIDTSIRGQLKKISALLGA